MTSPRERLLSAFHMEEADRVPVTFAYLDPFSPLDARTEEMGYARLNELIRQETEILLPASPKEGGPFYTSTDSVKLETQSSIDGCTEHRTDTLRAPGGTLQARRRRHSDVNTFWTTEGYIKSDEDLDVILSIPYEPLEVDMSPVLEAQRTVGDRGVASSVVADPVLAAAALFTLRDFALVAGRRGSTMRKLLGFFSDRILDHTRQMAEQTEDVLYRIAGAEYVTPPILPPELFEDYVVPYDAKLVRIVEANDNIACIHCHGRMKSVIDGIRRIDPNVLEPIEPPPKGDMEFSEAKEILGDRTCMMGNIQFNDLEFLRREQIHELTKTAIAQGGPGGGMVLCGSARPVGRIHDRLLGNYQEMVLTARKEGRYGSGRD